MFKNMSMKTRIIIVGIVVLVVALVSPTKEENEAFELKKMEQLKSEVLKIPALEVGENLEAYSKLSQYYKDNQEYKKKYNKYKKLDAVATYCLAQSVSLNKKSLTNSNTYDNERYNFAKWISSSEFVTDFTFTGKNAFGVEYKFNARYKCKVLKDGKATIEKVYIKQL